MFINKGPKILVFFITYRCNSRCIMCHIWEKQNTILEMDLEQIEKLFQDPLLRHSLEIINITGGEPTLHPGLREITEIILKNCLNLKRIDMPTNGIDTDMVIDKTEQILALLFPKQKVKLAVTVSLDGVDGIYERIRNIPDGFNKVKNTIIELKELSNLYPYVSLGLNTVITKDNYNHLKEILYFAKDSGLGINFTLGAISEIGVESIKMEERFRMKEEEKDVVLEFIVSLHKIGGISDKYASFLKNLLINKRRITDCSFRQKKAVLLEPDGHIYLCGNLKRFVLGNVLQDDFNKLWQNVRFSRQDWQICKKCESNCYLIE